MWGQFWSTWSTQIAINPLKPLVWFACWLILNDSLIRILISQLGDLKFFSVAPTWCWNLVPRTSRHARPGIVAIACFWNISRISPQNRLVRWIVISRPRIWHKHHKVPRQGSVWHIRRQPHVAWFLKSTKPRLAINTNPRWCWQVSHRGTWLEEYNPCYHQQIPGAKCPDFQD